METFFTILIPAYNSERTVKRALDSVIKQEYSNCVTYVINDGSNDNTQYICESFEKKYGFIHVLNKTNGGIAEARNYAINYVSSICNNTKIVWLDSDDTLAPNLLKTLNFLYSKYNDIDAVWYKYKIVKNSKIIKNKYISQNYKKSIIYDNSKLLKNYLLGNINSYLWSFVADLKCYKDIKFPTGKKYEDLAIVFKIISNINFAYMSNFEGYTYYLDNPNSLTKKFTCIDGWNIIDYLNQIEMVCRSNFSKYIRIFQSIYLVNISLLILENNDKESVKLKKDVNLFFNKIKNDLDFSLYYRSIYCMKIFLMKFKLLIPIYKIAKRIK